jgi:ribosomal protein L22
MAAAKTEEPRMVVRAHAKYVRTSARKARLVGVHIRGKTVPEARAVLAFTPRAAARDWSKVLESAIANAEHNHELVGDEMKVSEAYADEGPTLKRFRPRAMGRATRIRKRTAHLTICLTPVETIDAPKPKRAPKEAAKKAPAAKPKAEPAEDKPAAEEKPKAVAKPKADEKPKAEAKPAAAKKVDDKAEDKPKRTPRRRTKKAEEEASE